MTLTVCLILLIISFAGCIEESSPAEVSKTVYVDDGGGADYIKIQDAINHVADGGTIFVSDGTYYEMLIINKSINLIGANVEKTIIDCKKDNISNSDGVVLIDADNCTIKGFKITCVNYTSDIIGIKIKSSNNTISNNIILYSDKGIYLDSNSKNNTISWNTISDARYGIDIYNSYSNNISKNNISSCTTYGIFIFGSDNNIFYGNVFSDNNYGIRVKGSKNNKLFRNTVINNKYGMLFCCGAQSNVIYYNVFKQNNEYNAQDDVNNQWDNESIGNFWDDYGEKYPDAIQIDSIWDTPYNITGGDNMDRFPLVNSVDI